MSHSNVYIQQAQSTQQVNRLASSRLPPLWVFGALLVLGWNEAMAVLFNPLLLLMVLVSGLFLRRYLPCKLGFVQTVAAELPLH